MPAGNSWLDVGLYIQGLVFDYIKGNRLKENVQFNNEVLGNWHNVNNAALANVAGQGFSKQIRNANGANIAVAALKDYGAIISFVDFDLTTNGTAAAQSWMLEDASAAAHGVDWRNRFIFAWFVFTSALPDGGGNEDKLDTVIRVTAANTFETQQGANVNAGIFLALGSTYTDNGTAPATLPTTKIIQLVTYGGGGPDAAVVLTVANGASGGIAAGDLILSTQDGFVGVVNVQGYGMVIASPVVTA